MNKTAGSNIVILTVRNCLNKTVYVSRINKARDEDCTEENEVMKGNIMYEKKKMKNIMCFSTLLLQYTGEVTEY